MSTWIPISERMPTREETNGHDTVWAVDERGTHWIWDYVMSPISRFVHPPIAWHAFPRYTPPKPSPTDTECANLLHYGALVVMNHINPNEDVPRSEQFAMVRRWFAAVTARIEREKGT